MNSFCMLISSMVVCVCNIHPVVVVSFIVIGVSLRWWVAVSKRFVDIWSRGFDSLVILLFALFAVFYIMWFAWTNENHEIVIQRIRIHSQKMACLETVVYILLIYLYSYQCFTLTKNIMKDPMQYQFMFYLFLNNMIFNNNYICLSDSYNIWKGIFNEGTKWSKS